MIDPSKVTNFNRNAFELQEWALFCFAAAGKSSFTIAPRLENLLREGREKGYSPFDWVGMLIDCDALIQKLKKFGLGQFKRTQRCWSEMIKHPELPYKWGLDDLLSIHGIGNKTARFFMLHSRPNQKVAVLDVHILHWLRDQGYDQVPKIAPGSIRIYKYWESIFLYECALKYRDVAELDLEIWNHYSKKVKVSA